MKTNYTHQPIRAYEKPGEWGTIQYTFDSITSVTPVQNTFVEESESEAKKKYVVALSMVEVEGYVSPIVDANSQSINSNIERVYYCDKNTLMSLASKPADVFNIDPVEQEFDYIEGEDLRSPSFSGQQFPATTVFFYELKDDSYIEDYMFYQQTFQVFVPDTVTSIGDYAFYTEGPSQIFMESETPPEKQERSFNLNSGYSALEVFTQTASEAYCSAWGLVVKNEQNGLYTLGAPTEQ